MRYLVIMPGDVPYYTEWVSEELFPVEGYVIDTATGTFSEDGKNWVDIEKDHL